MEKKGVKPSESAASDIFSLLVEASDKEKRKRREELLAPLGVKEFFVSGSKQ